ncbi:MAG TPA: phage major capsid protein [Actinomycetes bacterium]|nr:phage major capsid protein [Actinomycetes bacterium]
MAANPAHLPVDWDSILSTTMHNYRKTLTDNIFNGRPLLNYLMSKGRVRTVDGGVSIVEPIIYAEGEAGSYSEWQQLAVTPQEGISAAQYPWRQIYATIAISGLEEAQNNGKQQAINLLEAKVMQAEETLKNRLSKQIYGTLGGLADPAKDFTSLDALIDDTTAVGGIDPATAGNEFWASIVDDVGAVDATGLERAMASAYHSASDSGADRVDALFTDQTVYEFYESTLTPQVRYTDTKTANLGFMNLLFKQTPMYWDFDCPAGVVYGINSKYVGMVIHSQRNFAQTPFSKGLSGNMASGHATSGVASSVDARYSFITTYGNMTIRNRRRCFKLTNVSELVTP